MTDYIKYESEQQTLEYIILQHLLNSDLSADTLLRLSFGDNLATLNNMENNGVIIDKKILAIASYLEGVNFKLDGNGHIVKSAIGDPIIVINGTEYDMTSSNKKAALALYYEFVKSSSYTAMGYYNEGSTSSADRIHAIFKRVISYLVLTEEEGETVAEDAISLDDINFKQLKTILMEALKNYYEAYHEDGRHRYCSRHPGFVCN